MAEVKRLAAETTKLRKTEGASAISAQEGYDFSVKTATSDPIVGSPSLRLASTPTTASVRGSLPPPLPAPRATLPPPANPTADDRAQLVAELATRMADAERRVQIETRIVEAARRLGSLREGAKAVRKQRKTVLQEALGQLFKAEMALDAARRQYFRYNASK